MINSTLIGSINHGWSSRYTIINGSKRNVSAISVDFIRYYSDSFLRRDPIIRSRDNKLFEPWWKYLNYVRLNYIVKLKWGFRISLRFKDSTDVDCNRVSNSCRGKEILNDSWLCS